jgi:EPS-associated MarR family transcriptional regulator
MAGQRSKIKEDVHFRVLRLLQDNPEMLQRELAEAVGISVGGTHYVLNGLLEKGMIKLGNFTASTDKRRYTCVLSCMGIVKKCALTANLFNRKFAEYETLRAEIETIRQKIGNDASLGAFDSQRNRRRKTERQADISRGKQ